MFVRTAHRCLFHTTKQNVGRILLEILLKLYLLFQILQLKARVAEEVSRMVHQAPMQLCLLGNTLAKDAHFLDICRGFQVEKSLRPSACNCWCFWWKFLLRCQCWAARMGRDLLGREGGSPQYLSTSISLVSCWAVKIRKLCCQFVKLSHDISDALYSLFFLLMPGDLFDELVSLGAHLLGPPAILGLRARGEQLIVKRSPVFCLQVREIMKRKLKQKFL